MKPHLENHLEIATQPTATALCNRNKLQNCVMHALQPNHSAVIYNHELHKRSGPHCGNVFLAGQSSVS